MQVENPQKPVPVAQLEWAHQYTVTAELRIWLLKPELKKKGDFSQIYSQICVSVKLFFHCCDTNSFLAPL